MDGSPGDEHRRGDDERTDRAAKAECGQHGATDLAGDRCIAIGPARREAEARKEPGRLLATGSIEPAELLLCKATSFIIVRTSYPVAVLVKTI